MNAFFLFQTGRMLIVLVCLLAVGNLLAYRRIAANPTRKWMVWIGLAGAAVALLAIIALHYWRIPRGLSAQYYANSTWTEDRAIELDRYFEADGLGKRIDRFIDFNPNDFNDRYPFSGKPFTVKWEGWLHVPADGMRVSVHSNFDSWLSIDGALQERRVNSPNALDIGAPEARPYLGKKGWSFDEQTEDGATTFAWAANDDVEVILGIDEVAEYELSFRCLPFSLPGREPQQVRVAIDKKEIGAISLSEGWQTYTMPISAALIEHVKTGSLRIVFTFSYVAKPVDVIVGSNDARKLAAAFDKIELRRRTPVLSGNPLLPNTALAPGIHAIRLEAKSLFANPFIQLCAESSTGGAVRPLPEDLLFPAHLSRELLASDLPKDRMRLNALEIFEILTILVLAGALGSAAIPFVRQPRQWLSREALAIGGICLFAFSIRFILIFEMKQVDPNFDILPNGSDQLSYLFFARGIWRGYWPLLSHEPFYFNVLIAFYNAFCFMLFGENLFTLRTVTACMSTASIFVVYLITRRTFNHMVAYIAAALCCCNGVMILFDTSVLVAPLKNFLGLLSLWLLLKLKDDLSWRIRIFLGIFIGLDILSRATTFLFLPFAGLWMLLSLSGTFTRKIAHISVVFGMMFLTILPVTIRNYFSNPQHPFALVSSGNFGFTLWIGNNPSSNGAYNYSNQLFQETCKRLRQTGGTLVDEVLRYIKEHPKAYLQLELTKLKFFWGGHEIGNLINYHWDRQHLRTLQIPWINFTLLGPLSLMGMIVAIKTWRNSLLLYGFVGFQMGLLLLFWVLSRYRILAVPVLSIFAAYLIQYVGQMIRTRRWRMVSMIIVGFLFCYVFLNYSWAAQLYEFDHGEPMPLSRLWRYWDLFYTW